jgi:hypothetical protein
MKCPRTNASPSVTPICRITKLLPQTEIAPGNGLSPWMVQAHTQPLSFIPDSRLECNTFSGLVTRYYPPRPVGRRSRLDSSLAGCSTPGWDRCHQKTSKLVQIRTYSNGPCHIVGHGLAAPRVSGPETRARGFGYVPGRESGKWQAAFRSLRNKPGDWLPARDGFLLAPASRTVSFCPLPLWRHADNTCL